MIENLLQLKALRDKWVFHGGDKELFAQAVGVLDLACCREDIIEFLQKRPFSLIERRSYKVPRAGSELGTLQAESFDIFARDHYMFSFIIVYESTFATVRVGSRWGLRFRPEEFMKETGSTLTELGTTTIVQHSTAEPRSTELRKNPDSALVNSASTVAASAAVASAVSVGRNIIGGIKDWFDIKKHRREAAEREAKKPDK